MCVSVMYLLWSKASCGWGKACEKKEGRRLAVLFLTLSIHCLTAVEHFLIQMLFVLDNNTIEFSNYFNGR